MRVPFSGAALLLVLSVSAPARPDDDALTRYRQGWNPSSGGPQLVSSADVHPQGQALVKLYTYSEFGYAQYGSGWSFQTQPLPQKLSITGGRTAGRSFLGEGART